MRFLKTPTRLASGAEFDRTTAAAPVCVCVHGLRESFCRIGDVHRLFDELKAGKHVSVAGRTSWPDKADYRRLSFYRGSRSYGITKTTWPTNRTPVSRWMRTKTTSS